MDDIGIEKVAIIGMAGRFPGAGNINEFWQNLVNGVESLITYTDDELLAAGEDPETITHQNYVKTGTHLANVEMFDAAFFEFSPKEALYTNPQQRLFLEVCWEAMESSGYRADNYPGAIGVFGGTSSNGYAGRLSPRSAASVSPTDRFQIMMGNDVDFLATRVAYKLNLKGPALTIQTACSTSLVAIHQACQSLLTYQCDMALSGGVCVHLDQGRGYFYQEGMIFSPDGHCRAFDAEAQGTVVGQGAGIVVLKRLSEAQADNDTILAVINGSAINNDGAMKVGMTAPSVDGQAEVISMARALGDVAAESISYIEAHGTGTPLGDPIEIEALTKSFRESTDKKSFCAVGSVKTNIGHLDAAAGVTGLIKTVLALYHKQIPPSLHYSTPNPNINFTNSPFYINATLQDWHSLGQPRRAGVSSFGIGGTNAHAILEESPAKPPAAPDTAWQLLPLSARSSAALQAMAGNLAEHLANSSGQELGDVAYTLQVGRKPFNHRGFTVCSTRQDAAEILKNTADDRFFSAKLADSSRDVVFMFSGQGAQYVNMTRGLYDSELFYKEQIDACAEKLRVPLGLDIRDILFPEEKGVTAAEQLLKQTNIAQPALFMVEFCLAQLWMHWGIKPVALVGHSIGEYVAACLSGVFSLDNALSLVVARGRLMHSAPSGSMLAIGLAPEEIQPYLSGDLSLAVVNGAKRCVVSGEDDQIERLRNQLTEEEVNCQILQTSHAFHSHMMDPILDEFSEIVSKVPRRSAQIPFVSNVSGTWITEAEASSPSYWANHLRQTVNFFACVQTLLDSSPYRILLEVGPGQTLTILSTEHPRKDKGHVILASTRRPLERKDDNQVLLHALGKLWLAGQEIDWQHHHLSRTRTRVPLPTYPFERTRYWAEEETYVGPPQATGMASASAFLKSALPGAPHKLNEEDPLPEHDNHKAVNTACDMEILMADIWQKLLVGVGTIKADDNFFDLGGDSLQAVQMFSELEKETGISIPLATIYEAPVLCNFVRLIQASRCPEASDGNAPPDGAPEPSSDAGLQRPDSTFFFIKKLLKLARDPLSAFRLLKRLLLGTYYICWFRLCKRNVRIKFPFYAHSKIKIIGPGKVTIGSGCATATNALDRPTIVTLHPESVVIIGKKCALVGMTIRCKNLITIGDRTLLPGSLIQDFLFFSDPEIKFGDKASDNFSITIGDDVWLAMQSAILAGSSVGNGGVLSVQAVLFNASLAEHCLAYGNPIKHVIPINNAKQLSGMGRV